MVNNMKILQINIFATLSTGRIAVDLYKTLVKNGDEGCIAFARGSIEKDIPNIRIGSELDVKLHGIATRITDKTGFYSINPTKKLIEQIKQYNPDIIHLHNIHGYYINIELLFNFLKEYNKPVVWTLHDCWAFTGHCAYFDLANCNKWKSHCEKCPQKKEYPKSLIMDNSYWNFDKKKELFCDVKNMVLVTPSKWLAELVKLSFLKEYPIKVINNGIDLTVFKPTKSNIRKQYNLEDKFVILGVAGVWDKRKGLADFIELSKNLDDKFRIVVVGVTEKQQQNLPKNMIGILRTHNVKELAQLYSTADVFVNPTYEDNFPTTNLEALACGTPVITYNTGGSVESVNNTCGIVSPQGNINELKNNILKCFKNNFDEYNCANAGLKYDKFKCFKEYIDLYRRII